MPDRTCSVDGCDQKARARGWCRKHYLRWYEKRGLEDPVPRVPKPCSVSGCDRPSRTHGWCSTHYSRWLKFGSTDPRPRRSRAKCSIEGCDRQSRARGWCHKHYEQNRPHRSTKNGKRRALKRAAASEPYTSEEIATRDGWTCGICRKRIRRTLRYPHPYSLSVDHILPFSCGGDDVKANVQAAHLRCNESKGVRGTDQLRLIG